MTPLNGIFYSPSLHSALSILSYCALLSFILPSPLFHSALSFLSFCTLLSFILRSAFFHSALSIHSFSALYSFILRSPLFHSALSFLSFCALLSPILCSPFFHSALSFLLNILCSPYSTSFIASSYLPFDSCYVLFDGVCVVWRWFLSGSKRSKTGRVSRKSVRRRRKPVAQRQYVVSDTLCPALHDCEFE